MVGGQESGMLLWAESTRFFLSLISIVTESHEWKSEAYFSRFFWLKILSRVVKIFIQTEEVKYP